MKYYSTKNKNQSHSFREAVLKGLPDDNGLFMPENFPRLNNDFISDIKNDNIPAIAIETCKGYIGVEIPIPVIENICISAFTFPVPVVQLNENTFITELFHGPTLAFKDFGARFMARIMSYFNTRESKKLTILVATSGDTGGAVADGFYNVDGVEVYIFYPSGGVSELQEKQLTTYGKNIHALEIKGSFDDCQRIVKSAFLDKDLADKFRLSSANSINIARLIPQMVYYFSSYASVEKAGEICYVVPSGNFGNLTAGLFARKMGLPVKQFIAATNANDSVVQYLNGNAFKERVSVPTISNAMNVGNPSNFGRMAEMFDSSREEMQKTIRAISESDTETESTMKEVYQKYNYISDPHAAVGLSGWKSFNNGNTRGIILGTAHPAKFIETVQRVLNISLALPEQLEKLKTKIKSAHILSSEFSEVKEYLMSQN